jgi:hypothetical protein
MIATSSHIRRVFDGLPGKSRLKRANGLLVWSKEQNQKYDFSQKLEEFRADMKGKHGMPDAITTQSASASDRPSAGAQQS